MLTRSSRPPTIATAPLSAWPPDHEPDPINVFTYTGSGSYSTISLVLLDMITSGHEWSRVDMSGHEWKNHNHSQVVLEEVPLRVRRVHAPPVVDEHVEDAQQEDEERGAVLCLEANGDHDAGSEADDGDEHAGKGPGALEDKADEEEDEEDASGELEAGWVSKVQNPQRGSEIRSALPSRSMWRRLGEVCADDVWRR